MSDLFADTSFFIALLFSYDVRHTRATAVHRARRGKIITSDWVLIELANYCSLPADRRLYVRVHDVLRADANAVIVPADRTWFDRGDRLFRMRPDKEWSLTDCISFEIMRRRHIADALTADHHFEQAGFTALLK